MSDVPGSTFRCWLDGVVEDPCTSGKTYSGLDHGAHLFAVLARAPGGTWEEQWVEYEWEIGHTVAPITTIDSGPDIQTENKRAEFTFSADQDGVEFWCSLDGGDEAPCTSPMVYPRVAAAQPPGEEHTFEVTARHPTRFDAFGEEIEPLYEPITTTYEWSVVDTAAPDTLIRWGPAQNSSSLNAYFAFASDDPTATFECSLDWEGFEGCESPAEYTELLPGDHSLQVRAVDPAGNVDQSPETYFWTIDRTLPNTPVGMNVRVDLQVPGFGDNASLNFFEVALAGHTGLEKLGGGPELLGGYGLPPGGGYYEIHTTADFGDPVELCLPYDPAAFAEGGLARILHWDGSEWTDLTTTNDVDAGRVCAAEVEDFGIFVVAASLDATPVVMITKAPPLISESNSATFEFKADRPDAFIQCSIDGLPFEHCESPKTFTQLEPESHKFEIQAVGPNGQPDPNRLPTLYEWEIVLGPDTTPPDTRITKRPPALTANYIVNFEFTGSDDQTIDLDLEYECLLDGVLLGDCDSLLSTPTVPGDPYEVEVFNPGKHVFEVRAIDEAGHVDPTPAKWTFTVVDLTAPETSIELEPESETTATTAIFEFIGEEPDGTFVFDFECSLDGADFTECTSPLTLENLQPGNHLFQVRAVDPSGVRDITPEFVEWTILPPPGAQTPETFIAVHPGEVSGPDAIFGFQSDLLVEEFECSLDGEEFTGCEGVLELVGLEPGQHTLEVRAIAFDLLENGTVDPTPARHTWTVVGEPETTILSRPPAMSASASATFTFTSDQEDVTFMCSVDGSVPVRCDSGFIAGPLTQDSHEFEVYAVNDFQYLDGEPVQDQSPATYEWEVHDVTPPETRIVDVTTLGPESLEEPDSIRFRFTNPPTNENPQGSSDNGTAWWELGFECSLDGGAWEECDPVHYLLLEELPGGQHTLRVRAIDEFENVDPSPATYNFTSDAGPETTILGGPQAETGSQQATFTFAADPAGGATFQCSLDAGPYLPCQSGVPIEVPTFGDHELLVRARSPGGAVDLTPAEYSWFSGDPTPPVVDITAGPAVATTSRQAQFAFTIVDPPPTAPAGDVQLQCSIATVPDSLPVFCSSPHTVSNLPAGEHTFEVTAIQKHELVASTPATWEWTVEDHTPPDTTIATTPPARIGLGTPAAFTFTSNETDATFQCRLDNEPEFTDCAGIPPDNFAEFSSLEAGTHTLHVRAEDPSLNVDTSPASHTFEVVGSALTSITASVPPDPATTTSRTATFSFNSSQVGSSFQCSLDGAEFFGCTSPVTYTNLTFEGHTFEVRSTNVFGLVEEPPAAFEWTIALPPDAIPPETTILNGPADLHTESSATFTFAADRAGSTFECALDLEAFHALHARARPTRTSPRASTWSRSRRSARRAGPIRRRRRTSSPSTCRRRPTSTAARRP